MTIVSRKVRVSLPGFRDREILARVLPQELAVHCQFFDDKKYCEIASPTFLTIDDGKFSSYAEDLIKKLASLAHAYGSNVGIEWSVDQVFEIRRDASGRASRTFTLRVLAAIDEAVMDSLKSNDAGEVTKLDTLLALSLKDCYVQRAMNLISKYPEWRDVYDIIAFVRERGVKLTKKAELHKRTANHYRHLGEDEFPLPENAPSLEEARSHALALLRAWLDERAAHHCISQQTHR